MKCRNCLSLLNADEKLRLRMIKGLIQSLESDPKQGDFRLLSTELYSLIVQASTLTVTMWLSVTDRFLSVCCAFFFFFFFFNFGFFFCICPLILRHNV